MERKEKTKKLFYRIGLFLFALALVFICLYKLTAKYVDPWDEARHGVNAYEMLHGGSMVQSTYRRAADYYNLKPPLSMWCIMAGMMIVKDPVLALRLYAPICYLILAVIVCLFAARFGRRAQLFCLAALSINVTPFLAHMVRAGDADSLYVLLFSAAMLAMMKIRENHRWFYVCGLAFSLAFLTKSFHALLIAAIGGLFLLLTKQLFKIRLKEWGLFLLAVLLPIALWAALRFRIDGTAFFVKMWETDVMGRTGGELKSNPSPFWYYLSYYFGGMSGMLQVYVWALVLITAAGIVFLIRKKKATQAAKTEAQEAKTSEQVAKAEEQETKTALQTTEVQKQSEVGRYDTILGFALWILLPFVAFSAVSNKLLWYLYPSVTAILIAGALAADRLFACIMPEAPAKKKRGRMIAVVFFSVALLALWIVYYAGTFRIISGQSYNTFQILVRAVAGDEKALGIMRDLKEEGGEDAGTVVVPEGEAYKDCKIFVDYDGSNNVWAQQDVFVAEGYGDYTCVDGGIFGLLLSSYIEEKKGVLFTARETYEIQKPLYDGYKIIGATKDFVAMEIEY